MCHQTRKPSAGCAIQGTRVGILSRIWKFGCRFGVVIERLLPLAPPPLPGPTTKGRPASKCCLECPGSAKRSGGTSPTAASGGGREGEEWQQQGVQGGRFIARAARPCCNRSAERAASPFSLCPSPQFRFAWLKTEKFSKAVPAPNAKSSLDYQRSLSGTPRLVHSWPEGPTVDTKAPFLLTVNSRFLFGATEKKMGVHSRTAKPCTLPSPPVGGKTPSRTCGAKSTSPPCGRTLPAYFIGKFSSQNHNISIDFLSV